MPATDDILGTTLGKYRVERVLGRGSMGTVYYGTDAETQAAVAIKTMARENTDDQEMLQRFKREARVASQINHPNVAHVFESGQFEGMPYLVMEYVDGQSLAEVIKRKTQLAAELATEFVRQAALGLKAASEQSCIHRDIKPANLMVTRKGEIKVVDFGIAKNDGGDELRTAVGVVLGSPYYMSPEQSAAKPLDHRSDIYGLGATFYYLITGKPPFEGRNLMDVIQKRARNELVPIISLNPNVSTRVCDIVYKMMRPDPGQRYQTYDELIVAITAVKSAPKSQPVAPIKSPASAAVASKTPLPTRTPLPTTPKSSWLENESVRRGLLIGGGVLILVAIGLIVYQIMSM